MESIKANYLFWIIFVVNAAVDHGRNVAFEKVKQAAKEKRLIALLNADLKVDMSLLLAKDNEVQCALIDEALSAVATSMDGRENRKMGVERTGGALAIAYRTSQDTHLSLIPIS